MPPVIAAEPIVVISSSPSSGGEDGGGGERGRMAGVRGAQSMRGGLRDRLRSATKVKEKVEVAEEEEKEEEDEEEEEEEEGEEEKTITSCSSTPVSEAASGATNTNGLTASSSFIFPVSRVKRIVAGSEDRGRGGTGTRPNHETIFLANKAAEFFINMLATDSYGNLKRGQKRNLAYKELSSTVATKKRYEFLSDFVPEKVKAENALKVKGSIES